MGEFFKGWRRKIGCVTLVMACVCMGGWRRSLETFDEIEFRIGDTIYSMRSAQGGTSVATDRILSKEAERRQRMWTSMKIPPPCPQIDFTSSESPKRGLEALGFYFGGNPDIDAICKLPYWSIILPLTLVSAFLLLTKSRALNQKKIAEPIPEKVE